MVGEYMGRKVGLVISRAEELLERHLSEIEGLYRSGRKKCDRISMQSPRGETPGTWRNLLGGSTWLLYMQAVSFAVLSSIRKRKTISIVPSHASAWFLSCLDAPNMYPLFMNGLASYAAKILRPEGNMESTVPKSVSKSRQKNVRLRAYSITHTPMLFASRGIQSRRSG